ncbi:MAG: hypothetical protein Q4B27_00650 [Candidatus Saccharibacteria bacterium]|nr:hypothetical protein [Candidatus Saccharibacteria bacterium]
MPDIRANAAPYEAYPADLATELPTSTLADTKHTKGDDSPTAIFPTTRTTSYPYTPPTARFETPASPEAAVDESDQPNQRIIDQAHIDSLLTRAEESSWLGRIEKMFGTSVLIGSLGAVALAGIRLSTGYGARWEPDESSSIFSHITVVTPNETETVDPTDVANLDSQRYQDSFDQAMKGTTGVAIGGAMVAAGFYADRKSRHYLEKAQKTQKEA